jgi:hypothetical protein
VTQIKNDYFFNFNKYKNFKYICVKNLKGLKKFEVKILEI